jgi:hypothetical protein
MVSAKYEIKGNNLHQLPSELRDGGCQLCFLIELTQKQTLRNCVIVVLKW